MSNRRILISITVIILLVVIGMVAVSTWQAVNTATGNIDTVLTETSLTRTAIDSMGD